jgi:hypothetical protein
MKSHSNDLCSLPSFIFVQLFTHSYLIVYINDTVFQICMKYRLFELGAEFNFQWFLSELSSDLTTQHIFCQLLYCFLIKRTRILPNPTLISPIEHIFYQIGQGFYRIGQLFYRLNICPAKQPIFHQPLPHLHATPFIFKLNTISQLFHVGIQHVYRNFSPGL